MVKVFNFLIFHYLAPHYLFQSYGLVDVLRVVNSVKFLISLSKWYCLNALHNIRYLTSLKKYFSNSVIVGKVIKIFLIIKINIFYQTAFHS